MSIDRQFNKEVAHIYDGTLLSRKKNEILSFVTKWINLEGIMLSEISQRQILCDFTYM